MYLNIYQDVLSLLEDNSKLSWHGLYTITGKYKGWIKAGLHIFF